MANERIQNMLHILLMPSPPSFEGRKVERHGEAIHRGRSFLRVLLKFVFGYFRMLETE